MIVILAPDGREVSRFPDYVSAVVYRRDVLGGDWRGFRIVGLP